MKKITQDFVVIGKRETYHELGEYSFKIVLSPDVYKSSHESSFDVRDSANKQMSFDIKKWGRKMICSFVIDGNTSDGVSVVMFTLVDKFGKRRDATLPMWIVKPDEVTK